MAFSDLLTEYLDLRETGEPSSEWKSIDYIYQLRRERAERMEQLLQEMDRVVSEARLS